MRRFAAALGPVLLLLAIAGNLRSADARRLLVYDNVTSYSVEIIDHKGAEYVGLVELLEPLGRVEGKEEGKYWVLSFAGTSRNTKAKFRDGKKDVELPGGKIQLPGAFVLTAGRGYVPVDSLQQLVPQLTGAQTQFHAAARHLYLNGAGTRFSAELKSNPSKLVLRFSTPVSPSITAEGNALRLAFTRDPVMSPGNDAQEFKDTTFQSANFALTSTGAEYIVKANAPLVVNSSEGGRTLTIATAQTAAAEKAPPPAPTPAPSTAAQPQPSPSAATTPAATTTAGTPKPAFLVVIDAAHGGEETGASLSPKLLEKDITLSLSRRIAHELQNRGIQVTLLRNSDVAITPDQRAGTANTSHATIYLAVHASAVGRGVRVFTSLMPPTPIPEGRRAFIPWNAAQSQYLDRSKDVSGSIAFECDRRQVRVKALQGAVLPLSSVATAAVAIELAPNEDGVQSLASTEYAQSVAVAVANGIAAVRAEGEKK